MRLLRKIVELVDKDVAANSKPISMIGAIIPFLPFMIFVDGAPADRYPVLAGLAMAASIAWLMFVMWRYLRHLQAKLTESRKSLGSVKYWFLVVGTVLFILLLAAGDMWLSDKIGWPEAYGFDCHGRGCFFQDLAHSPQLLQGGNAYELGLFALLWWLPASVVAMLMYAFFKRTTGKYKAAILFGALASVIFAVQIAPARQPDGALLAEQAIALMKTGDLTAALAKLDTALAVAPRPSNQRGSIQSMRADVLARLGRVAEALPAAEESVATAPEIPQARVFLAALQLENDRPADAARTIVQVADLFAWGIDNLPQDLIARIMWKLSERKDQATRLELALALVGHNYTAGAPGATDWLRLAAVKGLVEQGRLEEARPIAASILGTEALIQLLVDRRYTSLWPDLEAKAGPGLARQLSESLRVLEAAHRSKPDDPRVINGLVEALRSVGRAADAAAIAAPATSDMRLVGQMGSDAFWTVNAHAYALAEAGQVDEADALMKRLLALGVKEHPDLISMAINHGVILLNHGRPKEALKAAERAQAYGDSAASGYGRMWIAYAKSCALQALDRMDEAKAVLTKMIDGQTDNPAAYTAALLCHDRLDDAEQVILNRLADPDEREAMLAALQDYQPGQQTAFTASMMAKLKAVRDRPAVRSAIDRVGRIIPVALKATYWGNF